MKFAALVLTSQVIYSHAEVYFKETFEDAEWRNRWVDSTWKGADSMGEWEWSSGAWAGDAEKDKGMRTKDAAKFYGISSKLDKPFSNKGKDLVVQFSVKNEEKSSGFCGGGYIKLLGSDIDQESFGGDTPYHIMFGPDLCGFDVSRIHLIFNHKGKNLLKNEDIKLEYADKNEFTHLYTLHVKPDRTYTVYFDGEEKSTGSLIEGWDFPKETIDDPEDKKPADWVDEEEMLDPEHVKPEGYDDIPEKIPDPEAKQPEDWDEEDDGEWEAPMISNPDYQGPFVQRKIPNPDYKGPFKPKQLPNPDFDPEVYAFNDIGSVGYELWIVDKGSIFDNVFVSDSLEEAQAFAKETFHVTKEAEKAAKEAFDKVKEEEEKAAADAAAEDADDEEVEDLDEEEPAEKEEL